MFAPPKPTKQEAIANRAQAKKSTVQFAIFAAAISLIPIVRSLF